MLCFTLESKRYISVFNIELGHNIKMKINAKYITLYDIEFIQDALFYFIFNLQ